MLSTAVCLTLSLGNTDLFLKFKQDFGKAYATPAEEAHRYSVFAENLKLFSQDPGAYGITVDADQTIEELRAKYLVGKPGFDPTYGQWEGDGIVLNSSDITSSYSTPPCTACERFPELNNGHPESWDWGEKGALPAVKNQEQCGDCWIFGAVASMEAGYFLADKTRKTASFSEQEMLDCFPYPGYGNFTDKNGHTSFRSSCDGGWPNHVVDYVAGLTVNKTGGLIETSEQPYTSNPKTHCQRIVPANPNGIVARSKGYINLMSLVDFTDEDAIEKILPRVGPISIALNAEGMFHYNGGVATNPICPGPVDHAVVLTGYGTQEVNGTQVKYWTVRNSWGSSWGNAGHWKVIRGTGKDYCQMFTAFTMVAVME